MAERYADSTDRSHNVTNIVDLKAAPKRPRSFSGGTGGRRGVEAETKNYLDAKMDSVRAQNDARFSEVLSRLDGIKDLPKFWPLVAAIAVAVVTIIGISVTVLSYASDRFDGGLAASALIDQITNDQAGRDAGQDAKLDKILGKLDSIAALPPKP